MTAKNEDAERRAKGRAGSFIAGTSRLSAVLGDFLGIMINDMSNPVGTGNQPKRSDAVRPRIAFRQRDSETPSPSRKAGHVRRALPAETSGYGGWNGCPLTGGAGKRGVGTRLRSATWFKSTLMSPNADVTGLAPAQEKTK